MAHVPLAEASRVAKSSLEKGGDQEGWFLWQIHFLCAMLLPEGPQPIQTRPLPGKPGFGAFLF